MRKFNPSFAKALSDLAKVLLKQGEALQKIASSSIERAPEARAILREIENEMERILRDVEEMESCL